MTTTLEPQLITSASGSSRYAHPAYGKITLNRVKTRNPLFNTLVDTDSAIELSIENVAVSKSFNPTIHMNSENRVTVLMTQQQWIELISSIGINSGSSCTITQINGEDVPHLPTPELAESKFKSALTATLDQTLETLQSQIELLDGALTKTKAAEIRKSLSSIANNLVDNCGYIEKEFDLHVNQKISAQKCEIDFHTQNS